MKKNWIYSKIKILMFFLIIIKKNETKIKLLYIITNSKKIFFYEYLNLLKKINSETIKNLLIINKNRFKNLEKLIIIEEIIKKNTVLKYKNILNNKNRKFKLVKKIIKNKILWNIKKYNPIIIIIIIKLILKIKYLNIMINNNKKNTIIYKVCGKILNKISILNIQKIENFKIWSYKIIIYITNLYIKNN